MGEYRINTAAPNLVCICIDKIQDGDYSGRIYHKYSKEEIPFFPMWKHDRDFGFVL